MGRSDDKADNIYIVTENYRYACHMREASLYRLITIVLSLYKFLDAFNADLFFFIKRFLRAFALNTKHIHIRACTSFQ